MAMPKTPKLKSTLACMGAKIRKCRQARGLTLVDTEELGPVSWQHWQKIESGMVDIRISTLIAIANVLKIHHSELLRD